MKFEYTAFFLFLLWPLAWVLIVYNLVYLLGYCLPPWKIWAWEVGACVVFFKRKKEKQTKGGQLIGDHKIFAPSMTARFQPAGSPIPESSTTFSTSDTSDLPSAQCWNEGRWSLQSGNLDRFGVIDILNLEHILAIPGTKEVPEEVVWTGSDVHGREKGPPWGRQRLTRRWCFLVSHWSHGWESLQQPVFPKPGPGSAGGPGVAQTWLKQQEVTKGDSHPLQDLWRCTGASFRGHHLSATCAKPPFKQKSDLSLLPQVLST